MVILQYEQTTLNPKSEARSTKQIQMSKAQNSKHNSIFEFEVGEAHPTLVEYLD
jgi:hypothetical protein